MESENPIDITGLVVFATLGVVILIFFIVLFILLYQKRMLANEAQLIITEKEHQKKLLNASLEIAEKERQKIVTNVHDEVGLALNVLKLNFNQIQKNAGKTELVTSLVESSYGLIDSCMEIVRSIYSDVMPLTLMALGIARAIKDLCRQIKLSGGAEVDFFCADDLGISDKTTELQLYRLIKEVLNNTIRHAKPAFIEINMEINENRLNVIILHNGLGITTQEIIRLSENSKGLGLKSILTRIGLLNGTIEFSESEDGRAQVEINCKVL